MAETSDSSDHNQQQTDGEGTAYRVLARKYRPQTFSTLIGQDTLVRTLSNAFRSGRLAHAFILTGVRGVGKTTTARIIARALNCTGVDGDGGPTTEPCGVCDNCRAIGEDRHVDVLEMDAASRTGVDDIRELIDGVRYRPTSARYKVYIIDEVHMLSKNAFNALLKTLEEPPEHVKFIFATTEIRKVPVTVLSRCQRFDLGRVDEETLVRHFAALAEKENIEIDEAAVRLVARAADGSVRDGLSLLDQAFSEADGRIDETRIRTMLGLADRALTFDLIKNVLSGNIADALASFAAQYDDGADVVSMVEDMLEILHWLTRIKVSKAVLDGTHIPEIEKTKGLEMADGLNMAHLARAWQMLLKGLDEVRRAPSQKQAMEMVLVRLAYASDLPTPEEALQAPPQKKTPEQKPKQNLEPSTQPAAPSPSPSSSGSAQALRPQPTPEAAPEADEHENVPQSFKAVLALADEKRDGMMRTHLLNNVRLVHFEVGRIEFQPLPGAPAGLAGQLSEFLNTHTPVRWLVAVSENKADGLTLNEQRQADKDALFLEAEQENLVKAVKDTFPGAKIIDIDVLKKPSSAKDQV